MLERIVARLGVNYKITWSNSLGQNRDVTGEYESVGLSDRLFEEGYHYVFSASALSLRCERDRHLGTRRWRG